MSRGYGFVEFTEHEHSLHALRAINNHPSFFMSANKRPIVEFALDDARKVHEHKQKKAALQSRMSKMNEIKDKAAAEALSALGHTAGLAKVIEDAQSKRAQYVFFNS